MTPVTLATRTAIILVGGRGTRLGSLTEATPKPMLAVAGAPFISHVLRYLYVQGVRRAVLSTGYLAEQFSGTLGAIHQGVALHYVHEDTPLGTGGAIQNALSAVAESRAFVLNGDTLFDADLNLLERLHLSQGALVTMALREVPDAGRYGAVLLDGERVAEMREKGSAGSGLINGGIYLVERELYSGSSVPEAHSFEKATLPAAITAGRVYGVCFDRYFIDIGVPEDLARAERDMVRKGGSS